MHEIVLNYNHLARKPGRLVRMLPEKFTDLKPEQTLHIVKLQHKFSDPQQFLNAVTMYLLGKLPKNFPPFKQYQMDALNEILVWTLGRCEMIKNFIPEIRVGDITLYGPSDGLANTRFVEFLRANEHLTNYLNQNDEKYVFKFIATLYRPRNPEYTPGAINDQNDCRLPYNSHLTDKYAALAAKMQTYQRQAVCLFYSGCCAWMQKLYPEAFQSGGGQNPYGYIGVVDNLAGPKYGTPAQVEYEYTHRILTGVCQAARNAA